MSRRNAPPGLVPLRPRQKNTWGLSPSARLNELLNRRDVTHLVRSMPVPDLYTFVKQLGLADAGPVLALASGDQIQRMTDLEVWRRDQLDGQRFTEWLEAVIAADPDQLAERVRALDPELLQALLMQNLQVYLREGEDAPDPAELFDPEETVSTPDDVFVLHLTGDEQAVDLLRRTLDLLYRQDAELARGLLYETLSGLPSTSEEEAYRVRQGRIEELGFVDFYDALSLFQPLPRGQARPTRREGPLGSELQSIPLLPTLLSGAGESFLSQAIRALPEDRPAERLRLDFARLANKLMVAEQWDAGDEDKAREALQVVRDHLSIGLEGMSQGMVSVAAELLWSVHPEHVFRACQTRLIELRRAAQGGWAEAVGGLGSIAEAVVVVPDPPLNHHFAALDKRRPLLHSGGAQADDARPFRSLAEIEAAASRISLAVGAAEMVAGFLALGAVDAEALRDAVAEGGLVTPSSLLLTSLAQSIVGGPFAPIPLSAAEATRFLKAARDPDAPAGEPAPLRPALRAELDKLATAWGQRRGDDAATAARALMDTLAEAFTEAYGALDLSLGFDPRFVEGPLLLRPWQP